MKLKKIFVVGLAAIGLAGCSSNSAIISNGGSKATVAGNATVASNSVTKIRWATSLNQDCTRTSDSDHVLRVIEQPQHGTATVSTKMGYTSFPADSPRSLCNRSPVSGLQIDYRPQTGFVGDDHLTYMWYLTTGTAIEVHQLLHVQ